ncbi:MAG: VCBS repeat-containing protein, partial [Verrucomicrobiae bacterium]|nr:VCBS repeat-containing protein [Verrucomicrobiae bacterium]
GSDDSGVVRFEDVTEGTGLENETGARGGPENFNGAAWADFDRDGDLDIYLTAMYSRRHYLFLNQGDGTFREVAEYRGADLPVEIANLQTGAGMHHGMSVALGDYDKNGWIDIHTTDWQALSDSPTFGQHNVLLRNLGPNAPAYFRNVSPSTGTALKGFEESPNPPLFNKLGFSSSLVDLDNDGWQDLAVVADFKSAQLFWNNGDGTFSEGTEVAGVNKANFGMGSTFADFDDDGDLDWFVTSRSDNRLYVNQGNRTFVELAAEYGVNDAGYGWGTSWFDFDNDADLDLIMTNGHEDLYGDYILNPDRDRSMLWENRHGDFIDVSESMGITDNGPGKALVVFDYDNDGDQDVFIANTQSKPILYRNDSVNDNVWLRVNLIGRSSNLMGLGARMYLKASESSVLKYHQVIGGSNFLGQTEMTAHFGLGAGIDEVDSLKIEWPSGVSQELHSIPVNQDLYVFEPADKTHWLNTFFSNNELDNEDISGDNADPDQDGLYNFFEYAFGLSPRQRNQAFLPGMQLKSFAEDEIEFQYQRAGSRTDLDFIHESSPDLMNWISLEDQNESEQVLEYHSDGRVTVGVKFTASSGAAHFIRIRVVEK